MWALSSLTRDQTHAPFSGSPCSETEAAIMESINRFQGEKTMVIIAHRLGTIQDCDYIYKVEDGKIRLERQKSE